MTAIATSHTGSGALFVISGEIPTNATWSEDIYFREGSVAMDILGFTWKMVFRDCEGETSGFKTLSATDSTLTVMYDENGIPSILRINVEDQSLNGYDGDFVVDLASEDDDGNVFLWAHGIVSLRPNPVVF